MSTEKIGVWQDPALFEESALLVARRLASFRLGLDADDPYAFNDREKLMAGIIVGTLDAAGFLNRKP